MSNPWHSLFFSPKLNVTSESPADSSTAAAEVLSALYQSLGWTAYDPFPGGLGTPFSLKRFAKQFVLPSGTGVVRVLSESAFDPALLTALSGGSRVLVGTLTATEGGWQVIEDGQARHDAAAFESWLEPGKTLEELRRALEGNAPVAVIEAASNLPPNVEKMAKGVNPKQIDKLMARMSSGVFGRIGGGAAKDEAQAFLDGALDWNSDAGRVLRASADLFTLPTRWREPTYVQAKDAYQAARALARSPNATLTPGERDALYALPDAIHFKPLFVGST